MSSRNSSVDAANCLPDVHTDLAVSGISSRATIIRDDLGIPHVYAATGEDGWFGQGFACAQDRLWHMDLDRRRGEGRLAEYLGASVLESDKLHRRMRLASAARRDYARLDRAAQSMLDAYARGVNAWLESARSLPVEHTLLDAVPEPWQPWHSLLVFRVRHVMMGTFEQKLARSRLVARAGAASLSQVVHPYRSGSPLVEPPLASYEPTGDDPLYDVLSHVDGQWAGHDGGSNNWAVGGDRTESGLPILAGDPHRALEVPNTYYQNHVSCPGFNVIGLSFPGVPGFPHFGHNEHVAWSITHAGADCQDLFTEQFSSDGPPRYLFNQQWIEPDVQTETIHVRNASPVTINTFVTGHGPVITDIQAKRAVSLSYTALKEPDSTFNCFPGMIRSRTAAEFMETMRDWVDPCNNLVVADATTIGYRLRGRLPVRTPVNAWVPVPGWTGEHDWSGWVPFEEMPSRICRSGVIVTANNRIVDDSYEHYITVDWAPGNRAARIGELLGDRTDLTVEDMVEIHRDVVSRPARELIEAIQDLPVDQSAARVRHRLASWDGTMSPGRDEPMLYSMVRDQLVLELLSTRFPWVASELATGNRGAVRLFSTIRSRLGSMISSDDRSLLPPGEDWPVTLSRVLGRMEALRARPWGEVHRVAPAHQLSSMYPDLADLLDPPPVPMGGDADCVQAAGYVPGGELTVTGASVARYVMCPGDWQASRWVVPLGASGHPASPHYSDQQGMWARGEVAPMRFARDDIERVRTARQNLHPLPVS